MLEWIIFSQKCSWWWKLQPVLNHLAEEELFPTTVVPLTDLIGLLKPLYQFPISSEWKLLWDPGSFPQRQSHFGLIDPWFGQAVAYLCLPFQKSKTDAKLGWVSLMCSSCGSCCEWHAPVNPSAAWGSLPSLVPLPRTFAFWVTEVGSFVGEPCCKMYLKTKPILKHLLKPGTLWTCFSPNRSRCLGAVLNSCEECCSFWFCFVSFVLLCALSLHWFSPMTEVKSFIVAIDGLPVWKLVTTWLIWGYLK